MPALPEQQAFINKSVNQHGLLVAGPGTGKTWTLERRLEYLAAEGVDLSRVSVITLTRSMAASLSERMPDVKAQTLHSFALSHLNKIGEAWGRRVVDPWEQENLVRDDLKFGADSAYGFTHSRSSVVSFLDRLSSAFRDDQNELQDMSPVEARIFEVFQQQRELFKYRLMDELAFDLVHLIEQGVEVPRPPTHILADEYQDFTAGELKLLQLFAEKFGTAVAAAGDDRQSIFGFRAADPLALHRFPEAYSLPTVDYLSRSNRCPKRICDFAEAVSAELPPLPGINRPALSAWPGRSDEGRVRIVTLPSPIAEARWVREQCQELLDDGVPAPDVMIIVSRFYGDVLAALRQAVDEADRTTFDFYDPRLADPIADDLSARLLGSAARLVVDPEDHMAWRTLTWATPGLGESRITRLLTAGETDFLRNLKKVGPGDAVCLKPLEAGQFVLNNYTNDQALPAREVVNALADRLDIQNLDQAILDALVAEVGEEAPAREWLGQIFELSISTQVDPNERPNGIAVRTIFSAKGLEAPHVFVMNAIQQSFSGRGNPADGLRQLYVAATRSSSHLTISAPRYLGYSRLGHSVNSNVGGLANLVTRAAATGNLSVEAL